MDKVDAVSVTVEHRVPLDLATGACSPGSLPTGNLIPLLHEIRHALARWLDGGHTHAIDLRSIPMSPGEEQRLLELLGVGEVRANLSALGSSEIIETTFPAVWVVSHYNDDAVLVGRLVEICQMPEILKSQAEDAAAALLRLDDLLSKTETTV
jgi:hydrogenase-1 operon protein HyaF